MKNLARRLGRNKIILLRGAEITRERFRSPPIRNVRPGRQASGCGDAIHTTIFRIHALFNFGGGCSGQSSDAHHVDVTRDPPRRRPHGRKTIRSFEGVKGRSPPEAARQRAPLTPSKLRKKGGFHEVDGAPRRTAARLCVPPPLQISKKRASS